MENKMKQFVKSAILMLASLLILTGCQTYMGYETFESKDDIPGTEKKTGEIFKRYSIKCESSETQKAVIEIFAEYDEQYQKQQNIIENREHIYLQDSNVLVISCFLLPLKWFNDCVWVWHDWNLAPNPPGFFTRLTYVPPFSWFAIFQTPPYLLWTNYKNLKEGRNVFEWEDQYGKKHSHNEPTKYIDREKVVLHQKQVVFSKNVLRKVVTEPDKHPQTAEIIIEGKKYPLTAKKDGIRISRDMLPQEFHSLEIQMTVKYENSDIPFNISAVPYLSEKELFSLCVKIAQTSKNRQDVVKALQKLRAWAENGNMDAAKSVAQILENGNFMSAPDKKQALKYYKTAADKGDIESAIAICRLSDYWNKEFDAGQYIITAKNAGDNNGLRLYAHRLKNVDEAIKIIKQLADKGDATSQAEMAVFLGYGRWNTTKDPIDGLAESIATMLGGVQTLRQLDYEQALVYMQKAADNGIKSVNINGKIVEAKFILSNLRQKIEQYRKAKIARQNAEQDFKRQAKGFTLLEDVVKKSVFNIDRSRTVQEALSAQMTNLKWRHFQNKRNQTVVEVVGTWKHDKYKGQLLSPQKGDEVMVQFIILRSGYSHVKFHYGEIRDKNGVAKNLVAVIGEMKYIMLSAVTSDMGIDPDSFLKGLYDMN